MPADGIARARYLAQRSAEPRTDQAADRSADARGEGPLVIERAAVTLVDLDHLGRDVDEDFLGDLFDHLATNARRDLTCCGLAGSANRGHGRLLDDHLLDDVLHNLASSRGQQLLHGHPYGGHERLADGSPDD